MSEPLLVISGPTATGKSALALELAHKLDGEIISCDSVLVYRDFNIGSAKPSSSEMAQVPHHLIDICEPHEQYNAARFRKECLQCVIDIRRRGKQPIIVGGTTLYLSALLSGLSELPDSDAQLRAELLALSPEERIVLLREKDPLCANQIHAHDTLRIVRALEIILQTGMSLAESYKMGKGGQGQISALVINMTMSHSELSVRIKKRTLQMIESGLIEEVRELLKKYPAEAPPFSTVGYVQAISYLNGRIDAPALTDQICIATNQLAKRQRTFWRNEPSKRGWQGFPVAAQELNQSDVIRYQDTIIASKAKGVQHGFVAYRWSIEQIYNSIVENQQQPGISVYTVQRELSDVSEME